MMILNQARYEDYPYIEPAKVNIALVAGGPGCQSLITFLGTYTLSRIQINIVIVADPDENAPCLVCARDKGFYTTRDFRNFF